MASVISKCWIIFLVKKKEGGGCTGKENTDWEGGEGMGKGGVCVASMLALDMFCVEKCHNFVIIFRFVSFRIFSCQRRKLRSQLYINSEF